MSTNISDFIKAMEARATVVDCTRVGPYIVTELKIGHVVCTNKTHITVATVEAAEHAYREIMEQHEKVVGLVKE
jgi:hypothetical protein